MNKKQLIGLVVAGVVFIVVCSSGIYMSNVSKQFESSSFSMKDSFLNSNTLPITPHIGVVKVEGTILDTGTTGFLSTPGYDHKGTLKLIDDMKNSLSNKGILLYVNSPGGSVYDSDELYLKLKEYTEETKRPVWTYMADQACSGGYYISMASEKIYLNRNTWTGSIGVIISLTNYEELFEKIGLKGVYITSGDNKAMGAGDLELTEEQHNILQSLVDESYEQFVGIVAEGRKMDIREVKKIADGRIYSAKQALANKLVDDVATYEEVKKAFSEKLEGAEIYTPEKKDMFDLNSLFGYASKLKSRSEAEILVEFMENIGNGVPMYYAKP